MFPALLAAHLLFCSQCLGISKQLKSYGGHDLIFGKYGEYLPECGPGEYLNLCGECVSGKTEKDDGFGKDSCGICGGLETCKVQCSDPMDILDEAEESNGCLKFISMAPSILDIADSTSGSVWIFGDGINKDTVVDCSISKGDESTVPIKIQVFEDKIELGFPLPSKEGNYDLHCNTSTAVEFMEKLLVVDTNNLIPTAVDSPNLITWKENQVTVTVSKMSGPVDVLCFARTSSDVLFSEWTSEVEGNSLSSTVKCPPFVPLSPGEMEFGVAYSYQGIKTAKTVKVTSVAEAPRPVKAEFDTEKSKIIVSFDQNLEEAAVDCSDLFAPETSMLFGNASACNISVNEVHVILTGPILIPNTTLHLKDKGVTTRFSKTGGGGSVEVLSARITTDSPLPDNSLQCKKGQKLQIATASKVGSFNRSDIPQGQRQRLNLMAWRKARASTPKPMARSNSTQMETNAKKSSEESQGAEADKARHKSSEVWLQLRGPSAVDVENYAVFQATVKSCGSLLNPSKFKWSMTSDKDSLDTYFANGPKLEVAPGTLLPNSKYKLSVQAFDGKEPIASHTVDVETNIRNFDIPLQDAELVVGNGHALEIDASRFLDAGSKAIKLRWTCKKGFCYLPGKDKVHLDSLEAFANPHLRLPAKTLAVGRYQFVLEASSGSTKLDEAEVEVAVVSGQPPYVSSLTIKEEEKYFRLLVQVLEIRQECQLFWSVVPRVGYAYKNITEDPIAVKGLPTRAQNVQMSLAISKNSLIPGSKSLLRVSADCARAGHIYRQFRFFVPDGLNGYHLEVEPQHGEALQTEFVFKLIVKHSTGKAIYSFGYEENGIQNILYSGLDKEFKTYLGCCKFKTFAKLCITKSNCITQYGPELETTLPLTFNNSVSRLLISSYKELLASTDYEEALANFKMIQPTLEKVDPDAYILYCQEVEQVLVERIGVHTERMKKDKNNLDESLKMLNAASNLMATIRLSEDSMNTVLQFRDLVHANMRSISEKIIEKKISENLPSEPRTSSSSVINTKTVFIENSKKKSLLTAEAALKSKFRLLKTFNKDLMNDHRERSMLLDSILYYSLRQSTENDSIDPVLYKGAEHIQRLKRGAEEAITKIIGKEQMETVLKADVIMLENAIKHFKEDEKKERKEILELVSVIVYFSKLLCDEISQPNIIGSTQDLVLLGSIKNSGKKAKFPFCSSDWCPPIKELLNVSLVNINATSNGSEDVCFPIASIKEDILTNLIPASLNSTRVRRSAVYWIHATKYQNGVVPVIPYNISKDSEPSGHIVVQFPVWQDTKNSSNRLECWKFSVEGWNNSACVKMKETPKVNVTSLQCNCSFPGFFSVFAVEDDNTDKVTLTTKNEMPATTPTKVVLATTTISNPTTIITTTTSMPTVSTIQTTTIVQKTSEKKDDIKTTVTLKVPTTSIIPKGLVTTKSPIPSTTTVSGQTTSSSVLTKTTTSATKPITSVVTQPYDDVRTVPSINQPYKYSATFRINETYKLEVGEMKEKFEEHVEDQLQKILNMSESVIIEAWKEKDKIAVALRIPENKLQDAGYSISLLKDLLKNGSLALQGLRGNQLYIPAQDVVLTQQGGAAKSAITAFVTIVFIFLVILIGSVMAAFYLRNSREQRSIRITQDLHPDPPAPKYLRLHDSVSLDSSGPSTPQNNEMESSLAVLTRPQRRGYETMETFSHFPGNI